MDPLFRSLEAHHRGMHVTGSTPKSQSQIVSPQITTPATGTPHLRTQSRLQLSQQLPDTTINTTTSKDSQGKVCQQILQGLKCDSIWNKRAKRSTGPADETGQVVKAAPSYQMTKTSTDDLSHSYFTLKPVVPLRQPNHPNAREAWLKEKKNQHSFCIHDLHFLARKPSEQAKACLPSALQTLDTMIPFLKHCLFEIQRHK